MPINELSDIISYLAEMPSSGDARLHAEDYLAEDRRQGEEYDKSRDEIRRDEGGFEAEVYLDSEGYPTIGVGHKLTQSEIGEYGARGKYPYTDAGKRAMRRDFTRNGKVKTWSAEKGEAAFRADYDVHYKETRDAYNFRRGEVNGMSWDELPLEARNTVLNMGYNMGATRLRNKFPSMLKAMAQGQWVLAAHEIKYKDGGAVLRGEESALSDYYRQLQGHRVGEDLETARSFRQFERMSKVGTEKPKQDDPSKTAQGLQNELKGGLFPVLEGGLFPVSEQPENLTLEERLSRAAYMHEDGLMRMDGGLFGPSFDYIWKTGGPFNDSMRKRIKERAKQDQNPRNVAPNPNNNRRFNYLEKRN